MSNPTEGAVDALPNADADADALDELSRILTTNGERWPSGADFIEWCAEIVRATGRSAE